jgi:hypothetical protein
MTDINSDSRRSPVNAAIKRMFSACFEESDQEKQINSCQNS